MSTVTAAEVITELAPSFAGRLLQPTDAQFDDARRVHNGFVDKRPGVIARCLGAADVADALALAKKLGLAVAVRGGGHNVGGRGTIDDGLLIDLSLMKGLHVDPRARTARAEGGTLWKEFNRAAQLHGLATTGGVISSTGIAGLTLGGGLGWLMAKYGMALDNLLSVDLVLADGRVVRAAVDENADLFWGVRGGGGNFGVATSLEFRLHPVGPVITGGLVAHPIAQARDVLRVFRDATARASDDLMLVAGLLTGPDGVTKLAGIVVCHIGPLPQAEADLKPVKQFGTPLMDVIGPMPYSALNSMLDASYPRGARNYWKSHFLDQLTDDAIDALIDRFASCPTPMGNILLEHFHGAATRVPVTDTAYALRKPGFNMLLLSQWMDAAQDNACVSWARDSYKTLQPFTGTHRYVNYMDHDDTAEATLSAVYGPNLDRLRQVKAKYDPQNVFHHNVNIKPA
jgi:FAD/FMN-containing dehydrogenase